MFRAGGRLRVVRPSPAGHNSTWVHARTPGLLRIREQAPKGDIPSLKPQCKVRPWICIALDTTPLLSVAGLASLVLKAPRPSLQKESLTGSSKGDGVRTPGL